MKRLLSYATRFVLPDTSAPPKMKIPGVGKVILVASGKGGVGKSSLTTNLAMATAHHIEKPLKVGLLDCDLYGPSIHHMLELDQPVFGDQESGLIIPHEKYGMKVLSIGNMVGEDAPVIWRGPKIAGALSQMFLETDWDDLDILFLDLPPGTGDTQISISQTIEVDGAVVVTTPQVVALKDVRRAIKMFHAVDIPVVGVVENMSYHKCKECGEIEHIFGQGGGMKTAKEFEIPFLGEIPFRVEIMQGGEMGKPLAVEKDDAKEFIEVAENVLKAIQFDTEETKDGDDI